MRVHYVFLTLFALLTLGQTSVGDSGYIGWARTYQPMDTTLIVERLLDTSHQAGFNPDIVYLGGTSLDTVC